LGSPAATTLGAPAKGASLGGPPPAAGASLGGPPPKASGASLGGPPAKAAGASLGGPPVAGANGTTEPAAEDAAAAAEKKKKKKKKPAAAEKPKEKDAKAAKGPVKGTAMGKKLAEAIQKQKEAEEKRLKEEAEEQRRIEEQERSEAESKKLVAEEEAKLKVLRDEAKKIRLEDEKKKKAEADRLDKLNKYGFKAPDNSGAGAKELMEQRAAEEKTRKEEKRRLREEKLVQDKIRAEADAKAKAEEEARAAAAAAAPLVDDWMAAADDWSNINVDALAAIPLAEESSVKEELEAAAAAAAAAAPPVEQEAVAVVEVKAAVEKNDLIDENVVVLNDDGENTLRSPIVCVLGHVDVGKTKLLDYMRKTHVQDGEAGGITQQIGATFFPAANLEDAIQKVASRKKLQLEVPGLLVIDTPGHESFANLRSRGSGLCDLAILVVDLVVGLEKQTIESIGLLKMRKTPFVVALNKLDRIYEWKSSPAGSCAQNLKKQANNVMLDFQAQVNRVIVQFAEQGLNAELYWKNKDLKTVINMIPTSAHTGEGVPDLLMVISQLTQRYLHERITFGDQLQATVLEVKPLEGLGTTCDIILVNGVLRRGDRIVLCGLNGAIVTSIKTLLTPQPMKELRIRTPYQQHDRIRAAQGLKLLAPGHDLEKAVPGSPLYVVHNDQEERDACASVMEEFEKLRAAINKDGTGVYVQSSTLGALEALLHFLKASSIPVCDFGIGHVTKVDVIKASCMHERKLPEFACILAFDVKIHPDARAEATRLKVRIFEADIIYHLEDDFNAYMEEVQEAKRAAAAEDAVFPVELQILPDHIFNTKNPIIMGCRVLAGTLRPGTPIAVPGRRNLRLGKVVKIEANHQERKKAVEGDEVAVSIDPGGLSVTYGRQFDANDKLYSFVSRRSINALKEFFSKELTQDDIKLLMKLKKLYKID
jgi:translation initiation factor 5B